MKKKKERKKRKKSVVHFIKDCLRCEQSTAKRCRCKTCGGKAHGANRIMNHPIEQFLTPEEIESVSGIELI